MSENPHSQSDESLRSVLRQWRMETPLPPRFQERVWGRIERQYAAAPVSLWTLLLQWFSSSAARPAFALAYAVILLMAGATGGALRAQHQNARIEQMAQARYVQSVDPYQK
ncbi:MAG: hypothetical protein ABSG59_07600 [Verrucomicrobiota bacterium]|jgi:hypothetical protein